MRALSTREEVRARRLLDDAARKVEMPRELEDLGHRAHRDAAALFVIGKDLVTGLKLLDRQRPCGRAYHRARDETAPAWDTGRDAKECKRHGQQRLLGPARLGHHFSPN